MPATVPEARCRRVLVAIAAAAVAIAVGVALDAAYPPAVQHAAAAAAVR